MVALSDVRAPARLGLALGFLPTWMKKQRVEHDCLSERNCQID